MNWMKTASASALLLACTSGIPGTAYAAADYVCDNLGTSACDFDGYSGGVGNIRRAANAGLSATTFDIVFKSAGKFSFYTASTQLDFGTASFLNTNWILSKSILYDFDITAPGTYTLKIFAKNPTGKAASFTLNFDYAPVPEPAAWGMMIAGTVLAGTALRRRRRPSARIATA